MGVGAEVVRDVVSGVAADGIAVVEGDVVGKADIGMDVDGIAVVEGDVDGIADGEVAEVVVEWVLVVSSHK